MDPLTPGGGPRLVVSGGQEGQGKENEGRPGGRWPANATEGRVVEEEANRILQVSIKLGHNQGGVLPPKKCSKLEKIDFLVLAPFYAEFDADLKK